MTKFSVRIYADPAAMLLGRGPDIHESVLSALEKDNFAMEVVADGLSNICEKYGFYPEELEYEFWQEGVSKLSEYISFTQKDIRYSYEESGYDKTAFWLECTFDDAGYLKMKKEEAGRRWTDIGIITLDHEVVIADLQVLSSGGRAAKESGLLPGEYVCSIKTAGRGVFPGCPDWQEIRALRITRKGYGQKEPLSTGQVRGRIRGTSGLCVFCGEAYLRSLKEEMPDSWQDKIAGAAVRSETKAAVIDGKCFAAFIRPQEYETCLGKTDRRSGRIFEIYFGR